MDLDLLFDRFDSAASIAQEAIDRGILCTIQLDSLGLRIRATCGKGAYKLTYQKYVSYPDLKHAKVDVLDLTVRKVIEELTEARDGSVG